VEPFQYREENGKAPRLPDALEAPPPEVWTGLVQRIRRHERWRRIRQGGLVGGIVAVLVYGIVTFGPWSNRGASPTPETQTWVEAEPGVRISDLQHDRRAVQTALHELELMQKRFPHNTIIQSRWASIQKKAQAWTRLTSAGVWR